MAGSDMWYISRNGTVYGCSERSGGTCRWRHDQDVDFKTAHQILGHAAQEQELGPAAALACGSREDQAWSGSPDPRWYPPQHPRRCERCSLGHRAQDPAKPSELTTRGLEFAGGVVIHALGRKDRMCQHLTHNRCVAMEKFNVSIFSRPKSGACQAACHDFSNKTVAIHLMDLHACAMLSALD